MPYKAEVLFRQGWHVTVHWSAQEAAQRAFDRAKHSFGTANPARKATTGPLVLQETRAPDKTFDEWCDEQWPSTTTTSVPSSGSTSKQPPSEDESEKPQP